MAEIEYYCDSDGILKRAIHGFIDENSYCKFLNKEQICLECEHLKTREI